jgi:hypothetical protein
MLIKAYELSQQSRQEIWDAHTGLNLNIIVRGKVEKLKARKSVIYISDVHAAPTWLQGAVKAWNHRYRIAPDSLPLRSILG